MCVQKCRPFSVGSNSEGSLCGRFSNLERSGVPMDGYATDVYFFNHSLEFRNEYVNAAHKLRYEKTFLHLLF